jgi:hypothetical protein
MKTYRCYNTKLTEVEGWSTTDKRGQVEIHDENNKFAFAITFGKTPKISVYSLDENWENGDGDFKDLLFEKTIN